MQVTLSRAVPVPVPLAGAHWGGYDTEVGPETEPQQGQSAHHAIQTRVTRLAAPWMNGCGDVHQVPGT